MPEVRRKGTCIYCGNSTARTDNLRCVSCRPKKDPDYRRYWHIEKKYGITRGEFEAYWQAFSGKCGICETPMTWPESKRGQSLTTVCVDHNHSTGTVRGLLCSGCNKGLGLFKDNPEILIKAKEYLNGKKISDNS